MYKINNERRGGIAIKKILTVLTLCTLVVTGCGKIDIAKTYKKSEKDGILITYYEMNDGNGNARINISISIRIGRKNANHAEADSYYVVLTDDERLTFRCIKSLYSSSLEDIKIMEDSIIVEMK